MLNLRTFSIKKSGFTLIELLVVISIIAILSVIGLVAYGNFLKNSRDAKRQADLKFIQSALEDYHADQLYYPYSVTPGNTLTFTPASSVIVKTYLTKIPSDPKPPPNYSYTPFPTGCNNTTQNCISYCLYAKIERIVPTSDQECMSFPSGGYNYGVTRP